MAAAGRVWRPSTLQRWLSLPNTHFIQNRSFLSASYRCDEAWNKRLDNPLVSKINLGDFYFDLNRKHKTEGKVSAIDVDLYVNRIDKSSAEAVVNEMEDLVHRLRRSPETINTLESTHHAVVRILLDGGHTAVLLRMLTQPLSYGLFPDHITCNLLMHTFLQRDEYTAAARVAAYLMLQEDFGPPLTQALALASCYRYITAEDTQPWEDYTPKVDEPKEEVKIRIGFLRNPYFDDHFDLKEPHHIVGKTLAWLSPMVGGMVGTSCEALGWALYSKWGELETVLNRLRKEKESIAASVVSQIKGLVDGVEDLELRERLVSAVSHLEAAEGGVVEHDMWSAISKLAQDAAKEAEPQDIKTQEDNYLAWEKQRQEEYQRQMDEYRKKKLLEEIDQKKKDLAAREEVIYFFDNKEKLLMMLPEKKKKYYPKNPAYVKKKPRQIDETYIPPEV